MRIFSLRSTALPGVALSTVVATWSWWHDRPVTPKATQRAPVSTEIAVANERQTVAVAEFKPRATPMSSTVVEHERSLAHRSLSDESLEPESDVPDPNSELGRELIAADRRAAMATVWGLTKQQTGAFDAATEAPSQERLEVMTRFAKGEIAEADLNAELEAADERGLQWVHDVLGDERFNEYLSIRWTFETDEPEMSPSS